MCAVTVINQRRELAPSAIADLIFKETELAAFSAAEGERGREGGGRERERVRREGGGGGGGGGGKEALIITRTRGKTIPLPPPSSSPSARCVGALVALFVRRSQVFHVD